MNPWWIVMPLLACARPAPLIMAAISFATAVV